MILTQEQANAIADRVYPDLSPETLSFLSYDMAHEEGKNTGMVRAAYAKCLMDMNPLIEAGKASRDRLFFYIDKGINSGINDPKEDADTFKTTASFDTALSNLTE